MKTLTVYYSRFGNTRKVAQAIAETLQQAGESRTLDLEQLTAAAFEGVDLVVAGSPTHGFTVPAAVRAALTTLPAGILAGKSVAAFDTTVQPWPLRALRASPKLLRLFRKLGGKPVARPQTFFVQMHNTQKTGEIEKLLAGQIERARQWASEFLHQLNT